MAAQIIVIDTNIFLEFLLQQERKQECVQLMRMIEEGSIEAYMTSFALRSIEILLECAKKISGLEKFLDWVLHAEGLSVYQTSLEEEKQIASLTRKTTLDFDDALQYYVAQTLGAVPVSFDKGFDRTDISRMEPAKLLATSV